jgi:adenylate cyclase
LTHFALERTEHGWALLLAGQFEAAIVETVTAPCLSPADSFAGIQTSFHGVALPDAGRFEEALPSCAPRSPPSPDAAAIATP